MKRIYESILQEHHANNRQIAFLAGPRQVGKTTSAQVSFPSSSYLDWDVVSDRMLILSGPKKVAAEIGLQELYEERKSVIFDELHKYDNWKTFIKGFFDVYEKQCQVTVTGSAHLNVYKHGGDSLMGRYSGFDGKCFEPIEVVLAV